MGSGQAQEIGGRLIDLLTQQRLMCRQLRELAQKQSELVDGKNPEMLLRVLAGRQRIIDRLAVIDKELKPIRQAWEAVSEGLPAGQREQAACQEKYFGLVGPGGATPSRTRTNCM